MLLATNRTLADALSRVFAMPVGISPAPMWYSDEPVENPPSRARPLATFIGHMRPSHGYSIVPAVVREIAALDPSVQCAISLGEVNRKLPLDEYLQLRKSGLADVRVGWQPDRVMTTLIRESTVVVLPYARDTFRTSISGLLAHAAAHGRPCVAPSDTTMADQIDAGEVIGLTYEGEEPRAIAEAVVEVVQGSAGYLADARRVADAWRKTQSGPALVEQLMSWAEREVAGAS